MVPDRTAARTVEGVVQLTVSLRVPDTDQLGGQGTERDAHARLPGRRQHGPHVLVMQIDPKAGTEVTIDHVRGTPIQHRGAGQPPAGALNAPVGSTEASRSELLDQTFTDRAGNGPGPRLAPPTARAAERLL